MEEQSEYLIQSPYAGASFAIANASMIASRKTSVGMAGAKSIWSWEHYRAGELIDSWQEPNSMTLESLSYLLGVGVKGGSVIGSWYVATYENSYTVLGTETYASKGITECTATVEATRPAWTGGTITQDTVNKKATVDNSASKATFTYNASKTIYGGILVGGGSSAATKGDSAGGGTLYCICAFTSGSKAVVADDVLKVTISAGLQIL